MEVFKLAFETTMVGVLAFLWLGIAVDLLYPPFFARIIPGALGKNDTMLGVAVLSLAYCIGSAIIPISSQLVNDEHWPVPEDAIRCLVLEDLNDQRCLSILVMAHLEKSRLTPYSEAKRHIVSCN